MFWRKTQPIKTVKKKMVGLSGVKAPEKTTTQTAKPKAVIKGLLSPLQPYVRIVIEDIKRLLRIDRKARENREAYRNFMDEHFGKH